MHFKLKLILTSWDFDKEFQVQLEGFGSPGLLLIISRVSEEKDKRYGNALCTVLTEESPPTKIAEILQLASAPFPTAVRNFADELQGRLCDAAGKAVRLLRWFRGGSYGHNPIGAVAGLAYSADGNNWRPLPTTINVKITVGIPRLKMSDEVTAAVADLWRKGEEEPLPQELFREAAEQQHKNLRSSLVLAVAAAEVGLKQLVGNLVPHAKWLADNIPSPPLVKMLTEYFPSLPMKFQVSGTKPKVPGELIDTLNKAVLLRNQIAHGKSPKISGDTIHEIFVTVYDCLYLFDCCNGHRWAWDRITNETRTLIVREASGDSSGRNHKKSKPAK